MTRPSTIQHQTTVQIAAPADEVWKVLTDVARWPEWTTSMRTVRPLQAGPLTVGSPVRIKQPGVPATTWRVTRAEPGRGFDWDTSIRGIHTTATHSITELDPTSVRVEVTIAMSGVLVRLFGRQIGQAALRSIQLESAGLKTACEAR